MRARSSAASSARVGVGRNSRSSSSSSSSSGKAAIWSVRNCECAQSSISRCRAQSLFSFSSARYTVRPPMRSSTCSTRPSAASSVAAARHRPQQARQQRLQPAAAGLVQPTVIGALRATRSSRSSTACGIARSPAVPRATCRRRASSNSASSRRSSVGARLVARGSAASGANTCDGTMALTRSRWRAISASRDAQSSRPIASASRRAPASSRGRSWVCSSFHSCRRFSSRRRNRYESRQLRDGSGGSSFCPASSGSASSRLRVCSRGSAAAADQLERLHDEFDLADAAGPELDVALQLAARDFARDQRPSSRAATRTRRSRGSAGRRTGAARCGTARSKRRRPSTGRAFT